MKPLDNDNEWFERAYCRVKKIDPALFFPERGASSRTAEQLCEPCTVKTECLSYSLDNNLWIGIWGGKSGRQRRDIQQSRRR